MVDASQKNVAKVIDTITGTGGIPIAVRQLMLGGGIHQKTIGLTPSPIDTDG